MWNNYNDLDLHVLSPSGERIHNGNRTSSCGGQLDVDANEKAETRKPVENIFWPDGKAPPGKYQVFVHYYKKHKKRRSKDPTAFQIIAKFAGESYEYSGELTFGDPLMKVCEFILETEDERNQKMATMREQLDSMKNGPTEDDDTDEVDSGEVDSDEVEIPAAPDLENMEQEEHDGDGEENDDIPSAPDLDEPSTE